MMVDKFEVRKYFNDNDDSTVKYITVKEFVKGYSSRASEQARKVYLEGTLAIKTYERYEVVGAICDGIVAASYYTYDKDGNQIAFRQDSCKKYLMYVIGLISTYTNLQFDKDDGLGEFNMLGRYGLIDTIIQYIPESQVAMFDSVLNMKSNDIKMNYYEPHAFVREQLVKFAPMIHKWIEGFLDVAEGVVNEIDMEKVQGIMKK